jgi:signal transduction histidine kinase
VISTRCHTVCILPNWIIWGLQACKGYCTELAARQNAEIGFHTENIPRELSKEISLCLFRVLQEALQNAVMYSGVRNFQVVLKCISGDVELTVSDSGSGFDIDEATNGRGLGLTSMKERLKLVDGQLSIESKPGQGTTIHARVPLFGKRQRREQACKMTWDSKYGSTSPESRLVG